MTVTKLLLLLGVLTVAVESGFCQGSNRVDFEQLPTPMGCIRNAPATNAAAVPALKLQGMTVSGGQVLAYSNPFQQGMINSVYYTSNTCAGVQPSITITFDAPASNISMVVGQIGNAGESIQITDDKGLNTSFTVPTLTSTPAGTTFFEPHNNILRITMTMPPSSWTATSPINFFIDNIDFDINPGINFIDPVPGLMSGAGIVQDAEMLATGGTMVRAIAADGVARILLTVPANHVGEIVVMSVLDANGGQSNSTTQDGGLTTVSAANNPQQSIRVAAMDSTEGPMAFALYYPPSDFSPNGQYNNAASRTIQIQADSQAPNTPAIRRSLTILRPPVLLVSDLWEDPSSWDAFTGFTNDSRFFIRRAAFNSVLGSRISATIPANPGINPARAHESDLGVAYNAPLLLAQINQAINEFRSTQNAAAAQADVVVHGMGGVLSRAAIQLASYATPESYGSGSVDKLITIGTPHLGTPLATALLRNDNSCFAAILAAAGKFSFSNATVDGNSLSGAIGDLQGNGFGGGLSPALAQIQGGGQQTAPVAPIAGSMSVFNTFTLDTPNGVARFIRNACPASALANSLTALGWAGNFSEASDGFVPQTSQLAGFSGSQYSNLIHAQWMAGFGFTPPTELDARAPVDDAVITLLNTAVRGNSFHSLR